MMAETKIKAPGREEPAVVVDAHLAGRSAAIEIVKAGGKVILVDSEPNIGGNSANASSGWFFFSSSDGLNL